MIKDFLFYPYGKSCIFRESLPIYFTTGIDPGFGQSLWNYSFG